MASEQQAAEAVKPAEKKYCDICWGTGNKRGLHMQTCRHCGVSMHKECYGNATSNASAENFVCLACKAVGTTVTVRKRKARTEQRLQFTIKERPTECCLCSVDDKNDWPHAMHPVYDHYGDTGRQILLPPTRDKPSRPAWAHTLCCLAIGSHPKTGGCVFGCTSNGAYDGADDENSDTSSVNSDLQRDDEAEEEDDDDDVITHFVYCRRLTKRKPHNQWTKAIAEQQNELTCTLCGKDDKPPGVLRIPLQCSANDSNEFAAFRGTHSDLGQDTCYVPMHVGCAFWGRNDAGELPSSRHVYFFPGQEEEGKGGEGGGSVPTDVVTNIYCEAHAQDLVKAGKWTGATDLRYPKHLSGLPRTPVPTSTTSPAASRDPTVARMARERGEAKFRTSPTKPRAAERGDVRWRLGLVDPTVDRRLPQSTVPVTPSPKRPSSLSAARGALDQTKKKRRRRLLDEGQ